MSDVILFLKEEVVVLGINGERYSRPGVRTELFCDRSVDVDERL